MFCSVKKKKKNINDFKKRKESRYSPKVLLCNVHIFVIFSCYSGYQSVSFFRHMHFCNWATEWVQAHHYTSHCAFNPTVPTLVPCTIHRTAAGAGDTTLPHPTPWIQGAPWEGVGVTVATGACRGRWTRKGYPALQEAIVCSHSATKEGLHNNLLVAMK